MSVSLLITPGHPVLSYIQEIIERRAGCQLIGLYKPDSQVRLTMLNPEQSNATINIRGDPKQLAFAMKHLAEAIVRVE